MGFCPLESRFGSRKCAKFLASRIIALIANEFKSTHRLYNRYALATNASCNPKVERLPKYRQKRRPLQRLKTAFSGVSFKRICSEVYRERLKILKFSSSDLSFWRNLH